MWRTLYLPLLTLLTFDFHRDRLAEAVPAVRVNAALVSLDHDRNHGTETRGEPRGLDENSAGLVGKWRSNGEALEPKWRDGDTIPLLPFSVAPYSSGKIDSREEDPSPRQRDARRERTNDPRDSVRSRDAQLSSSGYEDRQLTRSNGGQRERDEALARKRNRDSTGQRSTTLEKSSSERREPSEAPKDDQVATRHRKTFQERQHDYGYEISDEEYSKPKPRKRRPPQNYEFALSDDDNSGSSALDERKESSAESTSKKPTQNAAELKSLLKVRQKEGSSLSEILQRRNLTLLDLLKGKTDAIAALKMRDVEENENSEGEAVETASDSFVKASSARKPQWSAGKDVGIVVPIGAGNLALREDRTEEGASSSSGWENSETYSGAATTGESMISSDADAARGETVVATATPVARNSVEVSRGDEAAAKSENGGVIRKEDLDEDEIMEFSDFTDYKKGRGGVAPVWLMMKEEGGSEESRVDDSEGRLEDRGSTLSIENILRPTDRSKSANNGSAESTSGKEMDIEREKLGEEGGQRVVAQNFAEDYGIFSEKEYQDDAPRLYDLEVGREASGLTNENDGKISVAQEVKSDTNFTEGNWQSDEKSRIMEKNDSRVLKNHQSNGTAERNRGDVVSEGEPEARAEIFELFASGSAGKRLERLLKSRNMSLEELIALRQRGSSKVHLAEVSRIKVQKSDDESRSNVKASDTKLVSKDEVEPSLSRAVANSDESYNNDLHNYLSQTTENVVNLDPSSNLGNDVQMEESTTEQLLPNLESETNNENLKSNEGDDIGERRRTVEIVDLLTTFGSLSFAKDLQRNFAGERNEEQVKDLPAQSDNRGAMLANNVEETIGINGTGFVEEVAKHDPNSFNVQTEYNILGDDESNAENGKALSKVKPSIIASGAILGVTLVVFLAIFIVCKIQQKQKYRYRSTFSRAVFQGPVMAARKLSNSSSMSNVMVNVVATSTAKRPERNEIQEPTTDIDSKTDIDNDSLDANDSWETIPDYMK